MGYQTFITHGYGICVDNIETTPDRLLHLASLKVDVFKEVRDFLDEIFDGNYNDEDLTMEDFDDLQGDYGETGLAYVLYHVIDELELCVEQDYNGTWYLLFVATYPWYLKEHEKAYSEEDVANVFRKYIQILTNKAIDIDYYSVENFC